MNSRKMNRRRKSNREKWAPNCCPAVWSSSKAKWNKKPNYVVTMIVGVGVDHGKRRNISPSMTCSQTPTPQLVLFPGTFDPT